LAVEAVRECRDPTVSTTEVFRDTNRRLNRFGTSTEEGELVVRVKRLKRLLSFVSIDRGVVVRVERSILSALEDSPLNCGPVSETGTARTAHQIDEKLGS